jgi:hypothetical protein
MGRFFSYCIPYPAPSPPSVTCLKAPCKSGSFSHILSQWLAAFPQPSLLRSCINPLLPCLVPSALKMETLFLQNSGINLWNHMAPKPKTTPMLCWTKFPTHRKTLLLHRHKVSDMWDHASRKQNTYIIVVCTTHSKNIGPARVFFSVCEFRQPKFF